MNKADICALIVTYQPDADFPQRAARIAAQVGGLLMVDNHSNDQDVRMLAETRTTLGACLILNETNRGVAGGLNVGVGWAQAHGYRWVLAFDQDTLPVGSMVDELLGVYGALDDTTKQRLAIIGTAYEAMHNPPAIAAGPDGKVQGWVQTQTVITSGSLLSLAALEQIGPFRDEFFIDYVDVEYCLRAASRGYLVLLVCKPLMQHAIGATTMHPLLWRQTGTSNHPAIRRYYMARNMTVLAQEYFRKEPTLVLSLVISRIKSTVLMILFENGRVSKLRLTLLGFWDGLTRHYRTWP